MDHGINVHQKGTSVTTPVVAASGVPYVVGAAPVHFAENPAASGTPVLCTSWTEAVEKLGYSDDWASYPLCEFMYSHFRLFACQPAIFCNVFDVEATKKQEEASDMELAAHKIFLPAEAMNDESLVVKPEGGTGDAYAPDVDYSVYRDKTSVVIEVLEDGSCYSAAKLNVAFSTASPGSVTKADIADGLEGIEQCLTLFGIVPDIICAPGYSGDSGIAALMATKAGSINGLFKAKALIDIDTSEAPAYTDSMPLKSSKNFVDTDEIVCWPMLTLGDRTFHMSTQLAGLMAQVDTENGGVPYESPSNKNFQCDGLCLKDGTEVRLTLAQANVLNANGIVTAINFMGGWVCWGNYDACHPVNTDVKDYFIPVSRMLGWVTGMLVRTFWGNLDSPMTPRLRDSLLDTCNIWLNGLVGAGYLLGARAEMLADENPLTDLMAGIIRFHLFITPPSPAQRIDFTLEYDVDYVTQAFS